MAGSLRDLAWSLWTELGVAGTIRRHQDVLVDPEALVLFTAALGNLDPRLRSESLDWCIQFGQAVSVSRLKNLLRTGLGSQETLDSYAAVVNAASPLRWPVKRHTMPRRESAVVTKTSGKSREPDLQRPGLFRLRLRAIFGIGTRADVLTELFYSSHRSAAELSTIGYTKRHVARALDDLTRAGLLSRTKQDNTHRFELTRPRELEAVVGPHAVFYAEWADCFRVLLSLHRLMEEQVESSQRLKALASRRLFLEIASSVEKLRWGIPVTATPEGLWPRTVEWALEHARTSASGAPDKRNTSTQAIF